MDFEDSMMAYMYWKDNSDKDAKKGLEYRSLTEELEDEIRQYLNKLKFQNNWNIQN